jgi:hypothetical protein
VLDGLDAVNWRKLGGACGSALHVPDQLRELAATDRVGRRRIYEGFCILHQGSVYEATAFAVPFLFEIARAPEVADRDEVLETLAYIAQSKPPPPSSFDIARKNPFTGQLIPGSESWARDSARWVLATRDALIKCCGDALALLTDPTPPVRATAALLLSWLPECRDRTSPAVRAAALRETSPHTAFLLALARLEDGASETVALATRLLGNSSDERERVAAALALAYALRERAPGAVRATLASATNPKVAWFGDLPSEAGLWDPATALALIAT